MKIATVGFLSLLNLAIAAHCHAQDSPATLVAELPESPGAMQAEAVRTSRIAGVVLDQHGDPIPGATVTLTARGRFDERVTTTAGDGSYSFADLPLLDFHVTASAPGFAPVASAEFLGRAGESVTAPKVILELSASASSVSVVATPDQIATEEVREQEHQRVLGVFPNFYTSYIWKAEPMSTKLKFKLAGRSLIDPFGLLLVAGTAGAEHYNGTYPDYGPGIAGYGKRFGAAYGDTLTGRMVGSAILPTVLHQDPRYFYQGSGSVASRVLHAMGSTFITRSDKGTTQVNFSHLGGSLVAGAVANAYHPPASRGLGLTFETFGITTGANMIGNLFREFAFRTVEPSVPVYANGRKP